jgi:hypothetical protein
MGSLTIVSVPSRSTTSGVNVMRLRRSTIIHSSPSGDDASNNGTHWLRAFACSWLCEGRMATNSSRRAASHESQVLNSLQRPQRCWSSALARPVITGFVEWVRTDCLSNFRKHRLSNLSIGRKDDLRYGNHVTSLQRIERGGRVLTGLYSAFANPVLERLGYGMANMRLISRDAGRQGTTVWC